MGNAVAKIHESSKRVETDKEAHFWLSMVETHLISSNATSLRSTETYLSFVRVSSFITTLTTMNYFGIVLEKTLRLAGVSGTLTEFPIEDLSAAYLRFSHIFLVECEEREGQMRAEQGGGQLEGEEEEEEEGEHGKPKWLQNQNALFYPRLESILETIRSICIYIQKNSVPPQLCEALIQFAQKMYYRDAQTLWGKCVVRLTEIGGEDCVESFLSAPGFKLIFSRIKSSVKKRQEEQAPCRNYWYLVDINFALTILDIWAPAVAAKNFRKVKIVFLLHERTSEKLKIHQGFELFAVKFLVSKFLVGSILTPEFKNNLVIAGGGDFDAKRVRGEHHRRVSVNQQN